MIQELIDSIESQLVESTDCEDCAWNAGLSTAVDEIKTWAETNHIETYLTTVKSMEEVICDFIKTRNEFIDSRREDVYDDETY